MDFSLALDLFLTLGLLVLSAHLVFMSAAAICLAYVLRTYVGCGV